MKEIILESTITCPVCGSKHTEKMPEDSCQFFWECPDCHNVIRAKKGDCCVYCSYGDVPCPSVQREEDSCC